MKLRHANVNYPSANWELLSILMTTYDFDCAMKKQSSAVFYELLAGGPLEGSTVDVPPSIAVTSAPLGVADCARKVGFLVAHGERDGASVADRHKSQSPQD